MSNIPEISKIFSFYAPAVVCTGVLLFSLFSSVAGKGLFFIFCVFLASLLRLMVLPLGQNNVVKNAECYTSQRAFIGTGNTTYSTFVICFALAYFLGPQLIQGSKYGISMVNYWVLIFFLMYLVYDLVVKKAIMCVDLSWTSGGMGRVLTDVFGGSLLGTIAVCMLYYSAMQSMLFINELNSNNEICSQPSKQQFKCSVYKNGELVKQTIKYPPPIRPPPIRPPPRRLPPRRPPPRRLPPIRPPPRRLPPRRPPPRRLPPRRPVP